MGAVPFIIALLSAAVLVVGLRSAVGATALKKADARMRRESEPGARDPLLSSNSDTGFAIDLHREESLLAHAQTGRQSHGKARGPDSSVGGEPVSWIDAHRGAVVAGVLTFFGLTVIVIINAVPNSQSASTDAKVVGSGDTVRLTRKQKLEKISIQSFKWSKEGFGSVMVASFVINNDNLAPIKDVTVTCVHETQSGTVIDRNTRTVYERIESMSYYYVHDLNMGFIHSQAVRSRCYVSDFVG